MYLIDTNIWSLAMRGETSIIQKIESHPCILSSIVLGELRHWSSHNLKRDLLIDQLEQRYQILYVTESTAQVFGKLGAALRSAGVGITENDLWLAAQAIEHQCTLVSRDGVFAYVPKLKFEAW